MQVLNGNWKFISIIQFPYLNHLFHSNTAATEKFTEVISS